MENKAIENILTRSSVRLYETGAKIPSAQVEIIMRCAMAAPSAVNKQPWSFIVVNDRETLKNLADALPYAKMTEHASMAIVTCAVSDRFLSDADSSLWVQDLSAVSENILLAVHALGYGGVWTCIYPHEERIIPIRRLLAIPDNIIPFNLIPIGKPLHSAHIIDKWNPDLVHHDRWPAQD